MSPYRRRVVKLLGSSNDSGTEWPSSVGYGGGSDDEPMEVGLLGMMGRDCLLAFLWLWSVTVLKLVAGGSELFRWVTYILARLFFGWLKDLTGGGLYNPLTTFASAVSGDSVGVPATVLGRIPAQVLGYVIAVKMVVRIIPKYYGGPEIKVNMFHIGILTEGILAFILVIVDMLLKETEPGFISQSLMMSITKLTLRKLGSPFTSGFMNPGSAFGWAYAIGNHMTKEHWLVYWFLPFLGTISGAWAFNSVVHPEKNREALDSAVARWKSD